MSAPATVARVNAALKAAGAEERLARGRGYLYFRGGNAALWPASAVYVAHVEALSVEEWVAEWRRLRAAYLP